MDVVNVLHHSGSGGALIRVGVVGCVPVDWEGVGRISPSGDTAIGGEIYTAEWVRDLDLTSPGGGNGDGGGVDTGDLNIRCPLI